jgi:hypothetical protein
MNNCHANWKRDRLLKKYVSFRKYCDPKSVYDWMFEVTLEKRGRSKWWWRVEELSGKAFMTGCENSRSEAKYQGERALFQLLMTTAKID